MRWLAWLGVPSQCDLQHLFQPVTSISISRTNRHHQTGNRARSPKEAGTTICWGTRFHQQRSIQHGFCSMLFIAFGSAVRKNNARCTVGRMERVGGLVLKLRSVLRRTVHQSREADPPPHPHPVSGIRLTGSRPGFCSHAVLQFDEAGDIGWKRTGEKRDLSPEMDRRSRAAPTEGRTGCAADPVTQSRAEEGCRGVEDGREQRKHCHVRSNNPALCPIISSNG